jgi:hypothetical protein
MSTGGNDVSLDKPTAVAAILATVIPGRLSV